MQQYKQRIQSVLDYIDRHLKEELSSDELARIALFSKSHFLKIFEAFTGHTLMAYIRGRRLQLAAQEIRGSGSGRRIADIACDFGFDSHDGFGRAIKREFGMTPEALRGSDVILPSFGGVTLTNERMKYSVVKSKIITKPEMKLIGIERRLQEGEGDGGALIAEMWSYYFDQWNSLFGSIGNRISPELEIDYALAYDGGLGYFIGIEVSDLDYIPPGTIGKIVPKTKYAKFTAVGQLPDSMGRTFDYIFKEWFPASPFQITASPILEHYDSRCASHLGIPSERYEMDVYIPIEPASFQSKEVVIIEPFQMAYYRTTGETGKTWKDVKKEAFDAMIEWAGENGLLSGITAFGAINNGGVPDHEFYYEVFMKLDDALPEPKLRHPIAIRSYEGGLHAVSRSVHRYLEPSGKALCEWADNSGYLLRGLGFEQFYVVNGKVDLNTMIDVHIRVEKKVSDK